MTALNCEGLTPRKGKPLPCQITEATRRLTATCGDSLQFQLFLIDPLDIGAQSNQALLDFFVAAVDVVDAHHGGGAFGDQAGDNQGCRGTQVAGHDGGTDQLFLPLNDDSGAFFVQAGSESGQLGDVQEAVGEDFFGD